MIRLPAAKDADLDWSGPCMEAERIAGPVEWVFDWGPLLYPHDSAFFSSCALAIEEFVRSIYPRFQAKTARLILYKGGARFDEKIHFSAQTDDIFQEFQKEFPPHFDVGALRTLFAANLLSEFLHRLASLLPEELIPQIFIEVEKEWNPVRLAQVLCKRRFEHVDLSIQGGPVSINSASERAISLPQDNLLDGEAIARYTLLLQSLGDARILPEELLSDYWDGVDELYVIPSYVSEWGKRMIKGFEAAGGEVKESE